MLPASVDASCRSVLKHVLRRQSDMEYKETEVKIKQT